jgi:hypothetical protein
MKKILMGLTAVFALSVAVPAFAAEEKKADEPKAEKKDDAKPAKKAKKKEAKEEK